MADTDCFLLVAKNNAMGLYKYGWYYTLAFL